MPKESGLVYKGDGNREKRAKALVEAATSKVDESGIYESKLGIHEPALTEALESLDPKVLMEAEKILQEYRDKAEDDGDSKEYYKIQDVMWGIKQLRWLSASSVQSNRKLTMEKMAKKDFYRLMPMLKTGEYHLGEQIEDALFQMATVAQNMAMARFPEEWKKQEEEHDEEMREELKRKSDEMGKMNVS